MQKTRISGCEMARCSTVGEIIRLLDSKGAALHILEADFVIYDDIQIDSEQIDMLIDNVLVTPHRSYRDPVNDLLVIDQFFAET